MKKVIVVLRVLLSLSVLLFSGTLPSVFRPLPATAEAAPPRQQTQAIADADWPQIGRDAQRTNYSPQQINPPYCYAWKWYGVPFASRAQPVVADARLFIGGMDGVLYARNATTGAPLWSYQTGGPIRHSAGVLGNTIVTGSHDGYTYALNATNGSLLWRTATGPSLTAPLLDEARGWVYAASSDGNLRALRLSDGAQQWVYNAGAPILTTPSLSADGSRVFFGSESIHAIAVNAANGTQVWKTALQGQSLGDRYPVVAGSSGVIYRSQPLDHFHLLLHEGDDTLNLAGGVNGNWAADWANVRPRIVNYLNSAPSKQTFFVLNPTTGASAGTVPVLYTFGDNDPPNVPVVRGSEIFVTYRARHGIQTDSPNAVHVATQYDAELGRLNLGALDITGLTASGVFNYEFRLTSDEPAMLTMGGNLLWVDNWERAGGVNVSSGQLLHLGNVSNVWPECYSGNACGPQASNPFFPLTGSGAAYPFPWPRVTDGAHRGGIVVANNMLYWRVIEGGLAGIKSGSCSPQVWSSEATDHAAFGANAVQPTLARTDNQSSASRLNAILPAVAGADAMVIHLPMMFREYSTLSRYVYTDLTTPVANPPSDLVQRLSSEVQAMLTLANGQHLQPYYFQRGFSSPNAWPYNTNCASGATCIAQISYSAGGIFGAAVWHDPGELLYTLAMAYPYLDSSLQAQVRTYLAAEMNRYPPLQDLPYGDPNRDWLRQGVARERYSVPFRSQLNNWPPVTANISALYAVWLWSKNTGDWSYACAHWGEAKALFNARRGNIRYYADLAGLIGYARLAKGLRARNCAGVTDADVTGGEQTALSALTAASGAPAFTTYRQRADTEYPDPRGFLTGWSAPVFFGLTPEVGQYLREQTGSAAQSYLLNLQSGNGVRWWYLTRVGVHAEEGETSFLAPFTGWSHFLARAYVVGEARSTLRGWLDRPWTTGDLYSIQKIVATIHAP